MLKQNPFKKIISKKAIRFSRVKNDAPKQVCAKLVVPLPFSLCHCDAFGTAQNCIVPKIFSHSPLFSQFREISHDGTRIA